MHNSSQKVQHNLWSITKRWFLWIFSYMFVCMYVWVHKTKNSKNISLNVILWDNFIILFSSHFTFFFFLSLIVSSSCIQVCVDEHEKETFAKKKKWKYRRKSRCSCCCTIMSVVLRRLEICWVMIWKYVKVAFTLWHTLKIYKSLEKKLWNYNICSDNHYFNLFLLIFL